MTEDCIHLKYAIEILVMDGYIKQYKKKDVPREDSPELKKVGEENTSPNKTLILVALGITRPEDFYFLDLEEVPLYMLSHSP